MGGDDAEHLHVGRVEHHGRVGLVDVDRAMVIFLDQHRVPHVIEMAVGEEQRHRLDVVAHQLARHAFRRVEADDAFLAFQQVAVGGEVASGEDAR